MPGPGARRLLPAGQRQPSQARRPTPVAALGGPVLAQGLLPVAWAWLLIPLVLGLGALALHLSNRARDLERQAAKAEAGQERFAALYEALRDTSEAFGIPTVLADAHDGTIQEADAAFAELAGTSRQRLRGRSLWGLLDMDPGAVNRQLQQAGGTVIWQATLSPEHTDPDGRSAVEVELVASRVPGLRPARVVIQIRGLADHRSAEQAPSTWQGLLDGIPSLVLSLDIDGRITFLNQDLPGTSRDQAMGQALSDLIDPGHRARMERALETTLEDGEVSKVTLAWTRDPDDRVYDAHVVPMDQDQRVQGAVVTASPVPAEPEVPAADDPELLSHAEAFFHATLDALSMAIAIVDHEGVITAANRAWRSGFDGHLPTEEAGQVGTDLIEALTAAQGPGRASHRTVARGIRAIIEGHEESFTREYAEPGESQRWVEVQVVPFEGPGDRGAIITYEDTTDRKRAEQERERASEQFEVAVGDLARSVGVAADPLQAAERLVNAALRVTRTRVTAAVDPGGIISLRGRTEADRQEAHDLLHADPSAFEWISASLPDAERPVNLVALPEGDELTDSDRKKLEILATQASLALQRAEVLERVRTAYERLDRSLEQKQVFMDVLSHDLKNPLAVARGRIELLSMKNPEVQNDLETVEESLDRAEDLIEKAVLYSKLEDQEDIERGERDLVTMVWEVADAMQPLAEERSIELGVDAPEFLICAAHPMLGRAIENLVSNAIKWSPEGEQVGVELERDGEIARLAVVDHGPGIPAEERRKLFTRFSRVDRSGVKGTGLGLAIAKRIVEMHKGVIWVEETPGGGSTFLIEIPREPGHQLDRGTAEASPQAATDDGAGPGADLHGVGEPPDLGEVGES